jgi:DNA-binding transcriptional MocR family regulator
MTKAAFEALNAKLAGAIRARVSSSNTAAQNVLLKAFSDPGHQRGRDEFRSTLARRYGTVRRIVAGYRGTALEPLPFNSGYFVAFATPNADRIRAELLETHGIGVVSIDDRWLRVAYSRVEESGLEELFARLFSVAEKFA